MDTLLCVDVGGTEIKSLLIDLETKSIVVEQKKFPSKSNLNKIEILNHFSFVLNKMKKENNTICAIAMAFPGPFDYENGISYMKGINKYDSLYGISIESGIKQLNNNWINSCKFIFLHDIASFALGCCQLNPVYNKEKIMYLCIGTGAGTSFTNKGELDLSQNLPKNGWIYNEPFKDSIIDDYISVRGFNKLSLKYFGKIIDGYNLQKLGEQKNKKALLLFEEFSRWLFEALYPFCEKYKPDRLILGGQIAKGFFLYSDDLSNYCKDFNIKIDCKYDTSEVICYGLLKKYLEEK